MEGIKAPGQVSRGAFLLCATARPGAAVEIAPFRLYQAL